MRSLWVAKFSSGNLISNFLGGMLREKEHRRRKYGRQLANCGELLGGGA
jgi:hypothetical protein